MIPIKLSVGGLIIAAVVAAAPNAVPAPAKTASCLSSGDGYLRAHLAGAIEANIDWPNSGTTCEGESKDKPAGVRLSFQRAAGGTPDLLLVFGLTGVRAGKPAHAVGVNLTASIVLAYRAASFVHFGVSTLS